MAKKSTKERLLIATRNKLLIWDEGVYPIEEDNSNYIFHHYYGITWDTENVYVAERKGKTVGIIKVFDKEFNLKRRLPLGVTLESPHQIFWRDGKLYVTDTVQDKVLIWDGEKTHIVDDWREHNWPILPNSIWCDGKKFYILEHRGKKMPKYVQIMNLDFEPIGQIVLPKWLIVEKTRKYYGVHNIYIEDGFLYMCNPRALMQYNLASKKIKHIVPHKLIDDKHYIRGLARMPGKFFIGISEYRVRSERFKGGSRVLVTDDDFNVIEVLSLKGTGALNEIRIIDDLDLAHNGISCPLLKGKYV